jgi:hypothetical protein
MSSSSPSSPYIESILPEACLRRGSDEGDEWCGACVALVCCSPRTKTSKASDSPSKLQSKDSPSGISDSSPSFSLPLKATANSPVTSEVLPFVLCSWEMPGYDGSDLDSVTNNGMDTGITKRLTRLSELHDVRQLQREKSKRK